MQDGRWLDPQTVPPGEPTFYDAHLAACHARRHEIVAVARASNNAVAARKYGIRRQAVQRMRKMVEAEEAAKGRGR